MQAHPPSLRHPDLVDLTDADATDERLVGAKAANLARAQRAGLPVLPGAVLTTAWDHRGWSHPSRYGRPGPALAAWRALGNEGERPLVVRSSSTAEDGGSSSMAGVFTSVLDVSSLSSFVDAVDQVLDSARHAGEQGAHMAVLVQPQIDPQWGGVLFGADPVTGRTDRLLLAAVEGGPDRLVSGLDDGWTAVLSRRGRLVDDRGGAVPLPRRALRALARLAARAQAVFGGPQDIEWAIDHDGTLWLLQSRPITTPLGRPRGRVLGTGPLAETFPEPLTPLESDLWLTPVREGLEHALLLTGTSSVRALHRSPVVREVDGWPVADLVHLGVAPGRRGVLSRLDPRPPARRLRAAWRTGRLSRALPALALDIVEQVDRDLGAVPRIDHLSDADLLAVLDNGRTALRALHGHEALAGLLVPAADTATTAASLALVALAEARSEGADLDELVERDPVVLALVPPHIGDAVRLPDAAEVDAVAPASPHEEPAHAEAIVREALRLRARWVQELTARAAWELGARLVRRHVLIDQQVVRLLRFDELRVAVTTRRLPPDLHGRPDPAILAPRPLPARFRLAADDTPVAVAPPTSDPGGVGAGGGFGTGPAHLGDTPPEGAVLVVTHLDPRLATVVPRLAGLVAETGSPLSHLAILAREHGVATVVGHAGATSRYREGQSLAIDGSVGAVRVLGPVSPADATEVAAATTEGAGSAHVAAGTTDSAATAHVGDTTGDAVVAASRGEHPAAGGTRTTTVITLPRRPASQLATREAIVAEPDGAAAPGIPDTPAAGDPPGGRGPRRGTIIPIGGRR